MNRTSPSASFAGGTRPPREPTSSPGPVLGRIGQRAPPRRPDLGGTRTRRGGGEESRIRREASRTMGRDDAGPRPDRPGAHAHRGGSPATASRAPGAPAAQGNRRSRRRKVLTKPPTRHPTFAPVPEPRRSREGPHSGEEAGGTRGSQPPGSTAPLRLPSTTLAAAGDEATPGRRHSGTEDPRPCPRRAEAVARGIRPRRRRTRPRSSRASKRAPL